MGYVIAVVVSLVVGGGLGYAFRGKEHAAIAGVGQKVASVAGDVAKKV